MMSKTGALELNAPPSSVMVHDDWWVSSATVSVMTKFCEGFRVNPKVNAVGGNLMKCHFGPVVTECTKPQGAGICLGFATFSSRNTHVSAASSHRT